MSTKLRALRGGNRGGEKPRRVHTCTECGREGFWDQNWTWYGSLQDEDEGTIRVKVCSPACMASAQAKGLCR